MDAVLAVAMEQRTHSQPQATRKLAGQRLADALRGAGAQIDSYSLFSSFTSQTLPSTRILSHEHMYVFRRRICEVE